MKTGFRFYGAAVSLSRRRSLRRGTPGHDGIPRALGIMPLRHRYKPVGVTLGKKPGFFGSQAFLFISVSVGRSFRFYGAAVSLSRRRSLRRGTAGHDGFPRALGIMPLRHRYKPVGVTLGKKLSSRKTGELLCLSGENWF